MDIDKKFEKWNPEQNFFITNLLVQFLENKIELKTPDIAQASYSDRRKSYIGGYKQGRVDTLDEIQKELSGGWSASFNDYIDWELKKARKE